ncbi:sugar transporter family protein [Exophiala viscosa]|uniref:Sugar transporter family protein n=1 Tax=Exophiala viscosa TaxID=2486360 RepID=A0AAN6DXS8_9EURO|nr:sugar transporter family protein [Exophiala viscosa]
MTPNTEDKPVTGTLHFENAVPVDYEPDGAMSIGRYLSTRMSTLRPTMSLPPSPFKLLAMLNRQQWLYFGVGMCAWTWDAFDFFSVSLTLTDLAASFHKSNTDISWGITVVLMLRSVGSIIFGLASDRYGRKWPFVINNVLFIMLELGTGFCQTYKQFLACRALFGIAMGGMYGNAVATALEDCPAAARGLMSGILQMGYILGYLLCTVFARALVDTTSHGWRPLYWFGACPPVLFIIYRLCLDETQTFKERETVRKVNMHSTQTFVAETKVAFRRHWLLLIYMVLLLAGLQFQTHGTQDLYPTLLKNQYGFSANAITVTQVVANIGAFSGGVTVGYLSQVFGRRLSVIVACTVAGLLLYPYTFTSSKAIIAAAFFEQFFVEGALGVVPIHLMELSPGSLRTFAVGTAYQLGNLASSASSTIEAKLGERFPLTPTAKGVKRYDYGKVMCILSACALVFVIILMLIGPEKRGIALDVRHDEDMEEVVGHVDIDKVLDHGMQDRHDDVEVAR